MLRKSFRGNHARVLIAYKYIPQYRRAFFNGLRDVLASQGVELSLIYGDPVGDDIKKGDAVAIEWAMHARNISFKLFGQRVIYQPILWSACKYDIVIVEQANKLLVNFGLLALTKIGIARLAYWGHGRNFQGTDNFISRTIKKLLINHAYWWFTYNDMGAKVVLDAGFPAERVTRVMNTIDNEVLSNELASISPDEVERQRRKLGLKGDNICIFVGGMYKEKRVDFFLQACVAIREVLPDFEVIVLGGGVEEPKVREFSLHNPWLVACGPTFGKQKAVNLKLAKLLLMPGLVGLAIIDSFTARVPIVTTAVSFHSPEIDYLVNGFNGEMLPASASAFEYADRVVSILSSFEYLDKLRHGCALSATRYTLEAMVNRFAGGVMAALC